MRDFARFLRPFPHLSAEENFSFARHTTIGCGGSAALAVYPSSAEETAVLLARLEGEGIPHCLLGAGANVLPADGFFDGVVVLFSGLNALAREGETLLAGAGVTGGALLRFAAEEGLGGFEAFTGIPMSVGGGIAMNAGVPGRHFSDVVGEVYAVEGGKLRTFSPAECLFSEKSSLFQRGIAVVGARLLGKSAPRAVIGERTEHYRRLRARLPKGRSMGCTFVNPPEAPAGKLIEACGFKGRRVGGARVSEEHANFILNEGGTSADVEELIAEIKRGVFARTGILLREEIRRIPGVFPPP